MKGHDLDTIINDSFRGGVGNDLDTPLFYFDKTNPSTQTSGGISFSTGPQSFVLPI